MGGLAALVDEAMADPFSGMVYVVGVRRANRVKLRGRAFQALLAEKFFENQRLRPFIVAVQRNRSGLRAESLPEGRITSMVWINSSRPYRIHRRCRNGSSWVRTA